jgi:tripartite-type tricarboxylate transporter receptor subunit TctC
MTEAGYPGVDVRLWSGVFAPAATPSVVAVMLEKALSEAVADPDVSAKLKNMAVHPGGANAAQFRAILASDIVKFGKVVKAAHLHFE